MKKLVYVLVVMTILAALATPSMAGGDQNMSSAGQGSVNQHQVMDPPPFNP